MSLVQCWDSFTNTRIEKLKGTKPDFYWRIRRALSGASNDTRQSPCGLKAAGAAGNYPNKKHKHQPQFSLSVVVSDRQTHMTVTPQHSVRI